MAARDERSPLTMDELILEARRLVAANQALQERLRTRRLWRVAAWAGAAGLAFYAWTLHTQMAEHVSLLRANMELVQSGNALLRAANARQREMQTALKQMRRPPRAPGRPESPRRPEGCAEGSAGCDSSTYWVPGFPGPRVSTKRAVLRPSI
ncbi:MAG TPA: hypothetical protein VFO85_03290 [Vicinamibacteria bacterium]|nr:hypothetical protein [Vicinamibacteria bacterium]